MFFNESKLIMFTKIFASLLENHLSVKECFMCINRMKGIPVYIKKCGAEISHSLEEGISLASAFSECEIIYFDAKYVSFISCAERTGNLADTVKYLLKRYESNRKNRNEFAGNCLYPFFILLSVFVLSVFMFFNFEKIIPDFSLGFDSSGYKRNAFCGFISGNIFLFACLIIFILFANKWIKENEVLDSINAISFMVINKIDMNEVLETSMMFAKRNRELKKTLVKARNSMNTGISFSKAFEDLGYNFSVYLELSEISGNMENAFLQIQQSLEKNNKEVNKKISKFLEPVLIGILTVYILILLKTVIMPVMFSYGF